MIYKQQASFWADTIHLFFERPLYTCTAEAAKLENSEKALLTFAAHLVFLDNLKAREIRQNANTWHAKVLLSRR